MFELYLREATHIHKTRLSGTNASRNIDKITIFLLKFEATDFFEKLIVLEMSLLHDCYFTKSNCSLFQQLYDMCRDVCIA